MQVFQGRWAGVPAWGWRVINSLTTWCQLFLVHAWHAEPMLYLLHQRIVKLQLVLQTGVHFYQGSVWIIVAMFLWPVFLQQYYQLAHLSTDFVLVLTHLSTFPWQEAKTHHHH